MRSSVDTSAAMKPIRVSAKSTMALFRHTAATMMPRSTPSVGARPSPPSRSTTACSSSPRGPSLSKATFRSGRSAESPTLLATPARSSASTSTMLWAG